MFKNISLVILVFLIVGLFSFPVIAELESDIQSSANGITTEKKVSVSAVIPLFQQIEVVKELDINYETLMENYNGSSEVVIEEAVTVKIASNADWSLLLNNNNLESEIMIKRSDKPDSEWQNLSFSRAVFEGNNGIENISFDLKVTPNNNFVTAADNLEIDLDYEIGLAF